MKPIVMRRHLTFLLLAGVVALSACRSKPKKKVAELPEEPPVVGHSGKVRLHSVESESEAGKGAAGRAKPKAGRRMATRMPMIEITTSISTRVNARCKLLRRGIFIGQLR